MKLGIIGLPQSGKTTVFNAASGKQEQVGDFSRAEHRAIIKVPDHRLDDLVSIHETKKVTHAEIEFLDAGGFTGKGKSGSGEIDITPDLKQMDAYVIVLDAFSADSDPEHDFNTVVDEMILADLIVVEHNVEKIGRTIKLTGKQDRARELELLRQCRDILNEGRMIAELDLNENDEKTLRGYTFLSQKPQLLVFNISEDKLPRFDELFDYYSKHIHEGLRKIALICGKIEMELVALPQEERKDFLDDLGIKQPAIDKLIQRSYSLLGLISFFTVGRPECRAWTIRDGAKAPQAAGAIHTDFERGFIRAEVASYEDYMKYKTLPELKTAARLHVEGKDYVVRDGDVILFRFNV
jgi:GTP-binding protein YchF